ncbi:hypothetical protein HU200_005027 [Digitaria exilis]|uniref:F-box domain-containing protein n=1 Tax=Digitaria exilis TaxID=1010633 RepID=A0A835KT81_9POAL|nr:hypothetical protein HU200_005027 [Digitaria exilis]
MPLKGAAAQGAPGGGGDRLGGLPDRILFRVMGHLKAWEAVRTFMLSTRWRDLWASASRLDVRRPCSCGNPTYDHDRTLELAKFVKNLLLRRRPLALLDSLRLCYSHKAVDGDGNTWIAYAVRHGAEAIELSGEHDMWYPSPEYMSFIVAGDDLAKNHLRILKLIHVKLDGTTLTQLCSRPFDYVPWIENLGSPGIVNTIMHRAPDEYPEYTELVSCNLKILKLSRVHLDDAIIRQLCSRCTSLEELELKDALVEGKEFGSTSLKYLTMISCKFAFGFGIQAPNLVLLRSIKPLQYFPQIQKMEFLATATIVLDDDLFLPDCQWLQKEDDSDANSSDESDHDSCDNKNNESDGSSNYYDSDSDYKVLLTRELKSCTDLKNLKTLSLSERCITPGFDVLAAMLGHSPNLENLFIHLDMAYKSRVGFHPRASLFKCTNLKTVNITCCKHDVMVHTLAEFFSQNSITNDKMFVHRTACSGCTGCTSSQAKRKAQSKAEESESDQLQEEN